MTSEPTDRPSAQPSVTISEHRDSAFAGAWWPSSRSLAEQLDALTSRWPAERPRVQRILFSRPDWDDQPRRVERPDGGFVKTGSFPRDDTHVVTLVLQDGGRRKVLVIPPGTDATEARRLLDGAVAADGADGATRRDLLAAVS